MGAELLLLRTGRVVWCHGESCGVIWEYRGWNDLIAKCAKCHSSVTIKRSDERIAAKRREGFELAVAPEEKRPGPQKGGNRSRRLMWVVATVATP